MINHSIFKKTIFVVSVSILIFLVGLFPAYVQKYYSTGTYLYISSSFRFIASTFPFAIGDIVYALLIGFVLYKIIRFFKKRKDLKREHRFIVPLQVLNFFLILYIIFKVVWGLNYSRPSVSEELGIGNEKYNLKELVLLCDFFVNKTNNLKLKQTKNQDYSIEYLETNSAKAYDLMEKQNSLFRYQNPCLK
ncbi:MAG: DUF3810 family protein, partial [Chryseobacterium sp.]